MPDIQTDRDLFAWACKGDQTAARVLEILTDYAHVMDDLEDGDCQPTNDEIQCVMWERSIELPTNLFYKMHRDRIDAIVGVAAANWQAANKIERAFEDGATDKLHVAYIIRSSYFDLVTFCALMLGGQEWANEVALKARSLNQTETFDQYVHSLEAEAAARKARGA